MKRKNKILSTIYILICFCLTCTTAGAQNIPAFPGAEGYGKYTTGGRGGQVFYVTTLDDNNNPGSLRYAINQSGPRTILFQVSGTIQLTAPLNINNGDLTIAGHSAPGDGICLRDYTVQINASNIIIRYLRFRLGDSSISDTTPQEDAIWGRRQSDIIIDHCSMSWSIDECASFYDNENFTLQWCILSESLRNSGHPKGAHGYGGIWGGQQASFHHNLLADHDSRNPRFCGSRYSNEPDLEVVDFRNNVLWNWGSNNAYAAEGGRYNLINNYYKAGPASSNTSRLVQPYADNGGNNQPAGTYGQFYVDGNISTASSSTTADNWNGVQMHSSSFATYAPGVTIDDLKLDEPVSPPEITTQTAEEAYTQVLKYAGASLSRDEVDTRITDDVSSGTPTYTDGGNGSTDGLIDTQDAVGGWPSLSATAAPADSDLDGMPDDWEDANDLNKSDASDGNQTSLDGSYTNLEVYLAEVVSEITDKQNGGSPSNNNSSVSWPFDTDATSYITTGNIVGYEPATDGSNLRYYAQTHDDFTIDGTSDVVKIASYYIGANWTAETGPADNRYLELKASPKTGGTLEVNEISMYLGAWFTQNFKASIYYSTDENFTPATGTPLAEDISLTSAVLNLFGGTLDTPVTVNDGETLYVRIYPWNLADEGQWKLMTIYQAQIAGMVSGVEADMPSVSTDQVNEISTTSAKISATISSDGGAPVTESGIAYSTSPTPTISGQKLIDGTTSGTFAATVTELTAGTTYYARAYATNSAGTAYGSELSFTTLSELTAPEVSTSSVSNILAITALAKGNVSAWGGSEVTERGFCWSSTNDQPTIADSYLAVDGDLGSYSSELYPLTEASLYYVRAYAKNATGTGYGEVITFETQAKSPDITIVVAADGSGDYTTVQAAFDAVQENYTGTTTIEVRPGTYYEKLILTKNKVNVVLKGEDALTTILTYDDYAGKSDGAGGTLGTSGSYSVAIEADDFVAENITFENTIQNDGSRSSEQAVALRTNGDRQQFYNCRITGYQDTYYAWGGRKIGRVYIKNCYIEGSVDFIFGRQIVIFDNCELHCNRNNSVITAPNTNSTTAFGFVFFDCEITSDQTDFMGNTISTIYLGRPWQQEPKSAYIHCEEPANLAAIGWTTMTDNLSPVFAEYNCYGDGASTTSRGNQGVILTTEQAEEYSMENIFAKTSDPSFAYDWIPAYIITASDDLEELATATSLQNYPNPARVSTTIGFTLEEAATVNLAIFNSSGILVKQVLSAYQAYPGVHQETISVEELVPGLYFYILEANGQRSTQKMIIL
ncbi:putative secreted protein (Por secretion system target) [Mangrovibacterium marinum]|uniref:Putative secreted protein (Por secretion system target) n=1 Tax=Mangrovibacterium marinum TaxID=1639118 RepID=A0A2T5BT71_9BACT|nr:pectinesterase family protein [Mangrovibacterium marinum]PTN02620.1 putative secreted protein (Por secretion system target) [Mangrovibacterium marinum]